jgi:arylsulfatase A-like enzyme
MRHPLPQPLPLVLVLVLPLVLAATALAAAAEKKPNFVLILVDDLGRQDLGIEGSTFYETPHIDSLARRATRFERGYSACQVCSPSRAALQTGKAPARLHITDYIGAPHSEKWTRNTKLLPAPYLPELPREEKTLAEALREHGYRTFFAGKWHLGGDGFTPEDQGYEINQGGYTFGTPPGGFHSPYKNPKLSDDPPGTELPHRLGTETANFIRAKTQSGEPFFAMLSFYSVHAPIQCSEHRFKKFQAKAEQMGLTRRTDPRFIIDRTKEVRQVQDHPVYAGMMAAMDDAVGLVLNALKESGAEDHTVVVFTSDNGGVSSGDGFATSCLPFRGGKGRQWEGGIRQPLYIAWPGVTKGQTTHTPAISMDLYPTFLDIAGLPLLPDQHLDGASLVPALKGETPAADRPLFWHYPHYGNQGGEPSAIMIQGKWKLIHYFEDGRNELYDLAHDVGEQTDLASQHPDRAASMLTALQDWQKQTNASFPKPNPNYSDTQAAAEREALSLRDLPNREAEHARYLKPDFTPPGGWWDNPNRQPAKAKAPGKGKAKAKTPSN